MSIRSRITRLEDAMGARAQRVFCVRRYEGETTEKAFAAEHPGETAGPNDLVVVTIQFSGLTRAEALQQQRGNRSPSP